MEATNPYPIKGEGLSQVWFPPSASTVYLREVLLRFGDILLGPERFCAHDGEFRLLTKLLDPAEPIVFHFHARDEDVWCHPEFFAEHRFGKDEAYFFLEVPKGSCPYSHVGLKAGVNDRELLAAIHKGRDHVLELSPSYLQRYNEGFFTPAGVPHRPGTAFCLEVQQPSDVYTLLETHSDGRPLTPQQIHPGFPDLETALRFFRLPHGTRPRPVRALPSYPPTHRRNTSERRARVVDFPPIRHAQVQRQTTYRYKHL